MEVKKCSKCGELKDISLFSKNNKTKDKLHCSCKECDKEKYNKNREHNILKMREYKKNNPEKVKLYYKENQENYKKYRDSNKEVIKNYLSKYYKDNLHKRKLYLEKTKEERKIKRNIYEKSKRESDPIYKLKQYVRNRISFYLRKTKTSKKSETFKIIGCSPLELKIYLEKKFIDDMSWENQGKWHIDHIIPLSSAKTEDELYKLCHFTNLQPIWATDNIKKGSKII